jgi:hypothetical protein
VCVAGLQAPWGPDGYQETHASFDKIWHSEWVGSSILGNLKKRFPDRDTVIDLDCRHFAQHLSDPGQIHLGFHPDLVTRMVQDENGASFHKLMVEFFTMFERLSQKATWNSSLRKWVIPRCAICGWCDRGRHRSAAVMLALHWCLVQDCLVS